MSVSPKRFPCYRIGNADTAANAHSALKQAKNDTEKVVTLENTRLFKMSLSEIKISECIHVLSKFATS